jgi:hypothetical protein
MINLQENGIQLRRIICNKCVCKIDSHCLKITPVLQMGQSGVALSVTSSFHMAATIFAHSLCQKDNGRGILKLVTTKKMRD